MKHAEFIQQAQVFQWAAMQARTQRELCYLFAIPNAFGRKITPAQAGRYKAEGVRPGPPDICLPLTIPGQRAGLWIEMKAPERKKAKAGGLSDAQLLFRTHLIAEGYEYYVCYDSTEAIESIKDYLARYRTVRQLGDSRGTNRLIPRNPIGYEVA
jgi:hypothetical protein